MTYHEQLTKHIEALTQVKDTIRNVPPTEFDKAVFMLHNAVCQRIERIQTLRDKGR